MKRRPQKEKEAIIFERFSKLYFKKSISYLQPNPPFPDILIKYEGKEIGIEITELYTDNHLNSSGSNLAKNHSLREKVLELAVRLVKKQIKIPFGLYASFSTILDDKNIQQTSIDIAEIIISQLANHNRTTDFETITHKNLNPKINLNNVTIFIGKSITSIYYSPVHASWIPDLKAENIETSLTEKGKNINNYLDKCHKVWLLIVELGGTASAFGDHSCLFEKKFKSDFEKVFLLRVQLNELFQIQLSN